MKENSREEDITKIKQRIEDVKEYIEYGLPYSEYLDLENSFDNILSDYKRVLKENEELNNRCKNLDEEAQAYVEELMGDSTLKDRIINRLNKENEELKALDLRNSKIIANMSTRHFQDREKIRNSIPIQKIKDKIEQYKKILLNCNRFSDVDRIKAINERILELQTLLKNNKN